jgi:hypothetical protein
LPLVSTLPWPGLAFRNITPATEAPGARLDREFFVEAGLLGGDARITVHRDSPEDAGFREVFVSLDGESIAILQHGQAITTEVKPGPHRLRAHNTLFWKTVDLVLKPGEHARFTAINRAGWGTFSILFFLGAMPVYLTFERDQSPAAAGGQSR